MKEKKKTKVDNAFGCHTPCCFTVCGFVATTVIDGVETNKNFESILSHISIPLNSTPHTRKMLKKTLTESTAFFI